MRTVVSVTAIVAWAAFLVVMANWSNSDAAMTGAVLSTVVLGVVVGRWWLLLVPLAAGGIVALATLISDPSNYSEGSPALWAAATLVGSIAILALMGLGVGVAEGSQAVLRRTRRHHHRRLH